jgi:hypothetical protein
MGFSPWFLHMLRRVGYAWGNRDMIGYAFYCIDEKDKARFIGLLPERRKDPERITKESVMNFGRTIVGNSADADKIFFLRVTLDEGTGEISWLGKSIKPKEAF